MRSLRSISITVIGCVAAILLQGPAPDGQSPDAWTRPFQSFKLIGNIYWVGSYDLSTYLVTTPQGHILINTGVGDTAQQIKASVEQLGFKMADVKFLTSTHGHWDHVAGMAALKKMTGADLVVSEPDKGALAPDAAHQTPAADAAARILLEERSIPLSAADDWKPMAGYLMVNVVSTGRWSDGIAPLASRVS